MLDGHASRNFTIEESTRRMVLLETIRRANPDDAQSVVYAHPQLVSGDDLGWLLEVRQERAGTPPPALDDVIGPVLTASRRPRRSRLAGAEDRPDLSALPRLLVRASAVGF
jgi:hypothetical protein